MAQVQAPPAFEIAFEREADGRWIAEVSAIPGALAYGASQAEAECRVKALVLLVLAGRIEHHEPVPPPVERLFGAK